MRALLIPLIGQRSNIPSESCHVNFRWLWRKARELYPQFYAYYAVPEEIADLVEADLTEEERTYIEVIRERVPLAFHVQETIFDPELVYRFNRYVGRDYVDLVLTARVPIGHQLQLALRDWRGAGGIPKVVLWEPGIDQDFFLQREQADQARFAKAYSVATCATQYLTQREFDIGLEWGRRFLSPMMQDEQRRLGTVLQPAIKTVAPDPTENPASHTLFFGARLNDTKRIQFIVDFYTKVFALGYPVKITITSPSKIKAAVMSHMMKKGKDAGGDQLIEIIGPCGREQFAEVMTKATICLIASTYEGFPYGFLQIAVSGQLVLFPDRPWAHQTVPPGYPWIYHSEAEALALVRRAIRGEWRSMVAQQLAVMRSVHGSGVTYDYDAARWAFFTNPVTDLDWRKQFFPGNPILQMIVGYATGKAAAGETFTLPEALQHVVDTSDQVTHRHWDAPPARFWPRAWVYRVLTEVAGCVDLCDGPIPRFRGPEGVAHAESRSTVPEPTTAP